MSRKIMWLVTVVMGVALAALIIFQYIWSKNAIRVNEDRFNQLISQTMIDIADAVEQYEIEKLILRQPDPLLSDSGYLRFYSEGDTLSPFRTSRGTADSIGGRYDGFYRQRFARDSAASNYDTMKLSENARRRLWQDNSRTAMAGRNENWLKDTRIMVDRVIASMLMTSPSIEDRISKTDLQEIISRELSEKGLGKLHFEYAVTRWNNEIAMQSENFDIASGKEFYKVQLFPDQLYSNASHLTLYFPDRRNSRTGSLEKTAFLSMMLSLLMIGGFTLTVYIMFRQKRISEIRNDFVSNMTHELKTPISTIFLASQMLGDKSIPAESKNTEYISRVINEECRKLGIQVEKVLQTAIFNKGRLKFRLEEVNIHELIQSLTDNFSMQLRSRNGRITCAFHATDYVILADHVHISNVFSNLIDNAIKYCSRDPEIHIETVNKGPHLVISVADNGIGISKADQKRVFEKFYRVPTGNIHEVKGFGLGLSYVKMIVEEHNGSVELDSELYKGSIFKVILPVQGYGNNSEDKNTAG